MPTSNGSGHDVEYDVPESDPPPGGGHLVDLPEWVVALLRLVGLA